MIRRWIEENVRNMQMSWNFRPYEHGNFTCNVEGGSEEQTNNLTVRSPSWPVIQKMYSKRRLFRWNDELFGYLFLRNSTKRCCHAGEAPLNEWPLSFNYATARRQTTRWCRVDGIWIVYGAGIMGWHAGVVLPRGIYTTSWREETMNEVNDRSIVRGIFSKGEIGQADLIQFRVELVQVTRFFI